jgi:immune inhibitor A
MRSYLPLLCLLLVSLCLPPVFAAPDSARLLTQIASHAPQAGQRVVVDVYDPHTRQTQRLQGYAPEAATGQSAPGPQLMPPSPQLMRDPVKARQVRAVLKRQFATSRLNAPGWGPGPLDRLRPRATGTTAVTGTWRALVLLVDFSDKTATFYPGAAGAAHYNAMLFDTPSYTNSAHDYYNEVSCGAFNFTGAAVGGASNWYRAPQTYAYYANNASGTGTYPQNSQKLVEDITAMADADVDFSLYANGGSDFINALFIVHAGMGAEVTGLGSDIWSHKWETEIHPTLDGKILSTYSIEPEDGLVGVFCHEFGHVLGLPDLYDTDYSSEGAGDWSLMAGGSWGGAGALPTYMDAWSRYQLGWLTPIAPQAPVSRASIPQIEGNPVAAANGVLYKLWCGPATNEYWLVENRQQVGFDASIPGPGLLIWHIDEAMPGNDSEWYPGLSAVMGHYLVALEQADGLWEMENSNDNDNRGDYADAWSSSPEGFCSTSVPNSRTYADLDSLVHVKNISASGTIMTADIGAVDLPPAAARSVAAYDTPQDEGGSITVTWGLSPDDGKGFNDVTRYEIMRGDAAEGPFVLLASVDKGTKGYIDTSVVDYVDYYYQVVAFDASASTASRVTEPARARDDLAPPAVSVTAADTQGDLGGSISISWSSYVSPVDFSEYQIYRDVESFTDVSEMTPLKTIASSGTKTYQDKGTEDNQDYYYAVVCMDNSQPANGLTAVTCCGPVRSNPNYAFGFTGGLSMISIGLTVPDNNLDKIFDLGRGGMLSRFDPDQGVQGGYRVYAPGADDSFLLQMPGRGFWLHCSQPTVLNLSGAAATTSTRIDFSAGWNQLGNPYVEDVTVNSADKMIRIGGTSYTLEESNSRGFTRDYMWGWNGATNSYKLISVNLPFSTQTIRKGEGFFFLSTRPGQLVLTNPSLTTPTEVAGEAQAKPVDVDWFMQVKASTDGVADTDNFLGVAAEPERVNGIVSPPPATDGFDFSFAGASGTGAATSFVNTLGASHAWQATLTCSRPGAQVQLNWPDLSTLPRDARPMLKDLATGKSVYMRTVSGYSFALQRGETQRRFLIDISSKAGDSLAIHSLQTVSGLGGGQIFYSLSAPATVDIEVVNLAGRLIRRLSGGLQQAGTCSTLWNGLTDSGSSVPSGSYLVRLTARTVDGQSVSAVQSLSLRR